MARQRLNKGLGTHADAQALPAKLAIAYPTAYATDDPTRSYGIRGMPTANPPSR